MFAVYWIGVGNRKEDLGGTTSIFINDLAVQKIKMRDAIIKHNIHILFCTRAVALITTLN